MTQATSSNIDDIAIRVRGLKKSFGSFHIHNGIDLDIPVGKVTYIMGGSGCGKSLLLKQIMGFISPDVGTIDIFGERMDASNFQKLKHIRRHLGILFQNGALFDSLSVYDNVAFSLKERLDLSKSETDARVESLLKSVGLAMVHATKAPSELSGGQRKRVALARAVAMKPKIMMYDEPTTGLDPVTTMMVTNLIRDISEEHKLTTIVISHDTHVVFSVAENIAFLKDGKVRYVGPPRGVFEVEDSDVEEFFVLETRYKEEKK